MTDRTKVPDDGTTGTTVHFHPDPALIPGGLPSPGQLDGLVAAWSPNLAVEIHRR